MIQNRHIAFNILIFSWKFCVSDNIYFSVLPDSSILSCINSKHHSPCTAQWCHCIVLLEEALCFRSTRNTAQKYGLHEFGIIMYIKLYRIILFYTITYINQSSELHQFCCLKLKFGVASSDTVSSRNAEFLSSVKGWSAFLTFNVSLWIPVMDTALKWPPCWSSLLFVSIWKSPNNIHQNEHNFQNTL